MVGQISGTCGELFRVLERKRIVTYLFTPNRVVLASYRIGGASYRSKIIRVIILLEIEKEV